MKRTEPIRLDALIRKMIDATGLRDDYRRHSAETAWSAVMGPGVASYTSRIYTQGRTLHVYLDSAALKEELGYVKAAIVDRINAAVDDSAIDNIVIH